jgi:hypothetical protein
MALQQKPLTQGQSESYPASSDVVELSYTVVPSSILGVFFLRLFHRYTIALCLCFHLLAVPAALPLSSDLACGKPLFAVKKLPLKRRLHCLAASHLFSPRYNRDYHTRRAVDLDHKLLSEQILQYQDTVTQEIAFS